MYLLYSILILKFSLRTYCMSFFFFFSSRRRHTISYGDWSSDVCFSDLGAEISHGALAPERVVIADGKVRIADYVMGSAIEQLRFSSERYWKDLRVAVPVSAGALR